MEDSWKNNSYTTVQKERILELIKDSVDDADEKADTLIYFCAII